MEHQPTSKEWSLLYQFCQSAIQPNLVKLGPIPTDSPIQWEQLLNLAAFHKVCPLLHKSIQNWKGNANVPMVIQKQLKKKVLQITIQNLFQSKSLLQILSLFQAHQIRVIPYKGIVLSEKAYKNIAMRQSNDLDLLIQFKDFEGVKKLLLKEGYKENFVLPERFEKNRIKYGCEYGFILNKKGQPQIKIDLHWYVGDKQQQLNLSYADFTPFISSGEWAGLETDLLSPEGLLLSTIIHHSKEKWNRLSYVTDVAALLVKYHTTLNWELLINMTKQKNIENIFYLGVGMAQSFVDISLPLAIQRGVNQKKVETFQRKFTAVLPHNFTTTTNPLQSSLDKMWYQLSLRNKLVTKMKILYYNFLTIILPNGRDIEGVEKEKVSYWQIFFTKPFRLLNRYREKA